MASGFGRGVLKAMAPHWQEAFILVLGSWFLVFGGELCERNGGRVGNVVW